MNKLNIIKKVLSVIQGSQPVSDRTVNNNCGQVDSGVVNLMDETADESVS